MINSKVARGFGRGGRLGEDMEAENNWRRKAVAARPSCVAAAPRARRRAISCVSSGCRDHKIITDTKFHELESRSPSARGSSALGSFFAQRWTKPTPVPAQCSAASDTTNHRHQFRERKLSLCADHPMELVEMKYNLPTYRAQHMLR